MQQWDSYTTWFQFLEGCKFPNSKYTVLKSKHTNNKPFCNHCFAALRVVTHLALLNNIGKLSDPDEAVLWRDEQETVAAIQGGCSRLHQSGLDVPAAWFHTDR